MSRKEIVYFVGAGLSKALEKPGKPLPLMYDFVSVMTDDAAEDAVILQTLARLEYAGFSDCLTFRSGGGLMLS